MSRTLQKLECQYIYNQCFVLFNNIQMLTTLTHMARRLLCIRLSCGCYAVSPVSMMTAALGTVLQTSTQLHTNLLSVVETPSRLCCIKCLCGGLLCLVCVRSREMSIHCQKCAYFSLMTLFFRSVIALQLKKL